MLQSRCWLLWSSLSSSFHTRHSHEETSESLKFSKALNNVFWIKRKPPLTVIPLYKNCLEIVKWWHFPLYFRSNAACHPVARLMAPRACQDWRVRWTVSLTAPLMFPWWITTRLLLMVGGLPLFSLSSQQANRHDIQRSIIYPIICLQLCLVPTLFSYSLENYYTKSQIGWLTLEKNEWLETSANISSKQQTSLLIK